MAGTEQSVVLSLLTANGNAVSQVWVWEAVGDIEIKDSVELATEPGVMGRIGPRFPRSATFGIRLRNGDPRTPSHQTARAQHTVLRSHIGKLLYLDARASPPEKIIWTLENVTALDDNTAKNAYDVTVTAREILGGEFGDFIDPTELSTDTGLVPIVTEIPTATGIGDQTIALTLTEAKLRARTDYDQDVVSGADLYKLNYLSNAYDADQHNFGAVSDVSSGRTAELLIEKGPRNFLLKNRNHVRIFGTRLPDIIDCTLVTLEFSVLQQRFRIEADATTSLKFLTITREVATYNDDGSPTGQKAFGEPKTAVPGTPVYFKAVVKDDLRFRTPENRRSDAVDVPEDFDMILLLGPDKKDREFSAKNFDKYSLVVCLIGELPI